MKKLITACFAFMFLLAGVAGCPGTSSSDKSADGLTPAVNPNEGGNEGRTISTDDSVEDIDISLD